MIESLHKALRAAVVVIGHAFIAAVLVICAWAIDTLLHFLNGEKEMLVFGHLPLAYLFQTIDVAMIGVFGFFGLAEAIRIMRE